MVPPGLTLDETNHSGWEIAHHFLFFDLHVLSYGIADVDDVSLFEIKIVSLDWVHIFQQLSLILHDDFIAVKIYSVDQEYLPPPCLLIFVLLLQSFVEGLPGHAVDRSGSEVEVVDVGLFNGVCLFHIQSNIQTRFGWGLIETSIISLREYSFVNSNHKTRRRNSVHNSK